MLNLPEFDILKAEENEHFYRITVERNELPYMCTNCGWIKSEYDRSEDVFRPHQVKERTVSDLAMHSKAVKLVIMHRRYKCPACGGTFYEWLDSIDRNDKVTKRLKEYMQTLSLHRPFKTVAEEYGISHTSVKRYFTEYVQKQEENRHLKAPRVLGIDEAHLNKKMRGVFTDTEHNVLLEITAENNKQDIKDTIQSMDGWENIEVVTIDMAQGYRYAVYELLPNAFIVTDKYHVVQYAQKALKAIRLQVKEQLPTGEKKALHRSRKIMHMNKEDLEWKDIVKRNEWFERFPELKIAYWLKEGIRDMYNLSKSKEEALERFEKWESEIPTKGFKQFKSIKRTFNNHKTEIFNYFNHRYTNAFTESTNNIIKKVEKMGIGYTFDVLRAKVLYSTDATIKKPKYSPNMHFKEIAFNFESEEDFFEYYDSLPKEYETYGVDLNELDSLLESGKF